MKEYAQAITYAGTDGIISMFSLLLGLLGTSMGSVAIFHVLLLAALANAISMTVSDFNSRTLLGWSSRRWISSGLTFLSMILFSIIPIVVFLMFRSQPSPWTIGIAGIVALFILSMFHGWLEDDTYANVPVQVIVGSLGMFFAYYVGKWSDRALKAYGM